MEADTTHPSLLLPTAAPKKRNREPTLECERPKNSVCELYAGIAVMSAVLQSLGWNIAMLCEQKAHLRSLLQHKFPNANVQENVDDKPWLQWAAAGLSALLVVAGIACQPFSEAGAKRFQEDKRSLQALLVCDAAVALGTLYVVLENVTNYVTKDTQHGIFTRVRQYFQQHGFELLTVLTPRHDKVGGRTSRNRVLVVFRKHNHPAEQFVLLPHNLNVRQLTSPSCEQLQLDSLNLLQRGALSECGRYLQFNTELAPGSVVQLSDSATSRNRLGLTFDPNGRALGFRPKMLCIACSGQVSPPPSLSPLTLFDQMFRI